MTKPVRITIIGGGGMVGAASAYALLLRNLPAEILIVDVAQQLAQGQALDIADASFSLRGECRVGTFKEAGQSDLVIITAGLPQKPGEPRHELLHRNAAIMKSICNDMAPIRKDLKILVVANPVDALTYLVHKYSGLPHNQVFGSGTHLDSGRLRNQLASIINVHPSAIHIYSLVEHGDRQFVGWSGARVGQQPLLEHPKMKGVDLNEIQQSVMKKAYTIIDAKRSTYFGIGMCVAEIAESVIYNLNQIFPLSNWSEEHGVYMSWPCSVGNKGVEQVCDFELNEEETKLKMIAINALKEMVKEADA